MPDAVVIGSGPNGLVAANLLADEGWSVTVLEAQPVPGGAVRSDTLVDGFSHDLFSAFYPLAAASPTIRALELDRYGLHWRRAPLVIAHPGGDGAPVVLSQDLDETAASLDADHPGDGDAWRRLYGLWERIGDRAVDALLGPFPPIRATASLAMRVRTELPELARFAILPVRRLAEENFGGRGAAMLLSGNALHADLSPGDALSGILGWLLCSLGQQFGFPVPEGGAGQLVAALVARLRDRGGELVVDAPVERIVIEGGRAVAVRTSGGEEVPVARAVLADVGAPALYRDLIGAEHLPERLVRDLRRFQYDNATFKVDWAIDGPIPWKNEHAGRAGTVHVADGLDHLAEGAYQLSSGIVPQRPFLVMGQMTTSDPTRSPSGTESAWAYTHVPQRVRSDAAGELTGSWDDAEAERFADRMEAEIEAHAPGFRQLIRAREVLTPRTLEAANANLVGGSTNGGTAQLHQQVIFRPTPGLGRPETPVAGVFLASASAHPGGGVHGACGANAARAALWAWRRQRLMFPVLKLKSLYERGSEA